MKIRLAVYGDETFTAIDHDDESRRLWCHISHGARIADIEIDFEKLPIPVKSGIFGKGIVVNYK